MQINTNLIAKHLQFTNKKIKQKILICASTYNPSQPGAMWRTIYLTNKRNANVKRKGHNKTTTKKCKTKTKKCERMGKGKNYETVQ